MFFYSCIPVRGSVAEMGGYSLTSVINIHKPVGIDYPHFFSDKLKGNAVIMLILIEQYMYYVYWIALSVPGIF